MKYAYTIYRTNTVKNIYELFAIAPSKAAAVRRAKRMNEYKHPNDNDYFLVKKFNVENGGYPNEAETIIV